MTKHIRFVAAIGWFVVLLVPVSAFAQDTTKIGLVMGTNAISFLWQTNPRFAIRPDLGFATGSTNNSANGAKSDSFQLTPGFSALIYTGKWDALRTYITPRYSYQRSSTTNTSVPTGTVTQTFGAHSVSGSLGAEYSLNPKFGVFGEIGLVFSRSKPGTTTSHSFSNRAGIGAILFF